MLAEACSRDLRDRADPFSRARAAQVIANVSGVVSVETDEYGRPEPPLSGGEIETLLGFLDYQRATLAWKCAGLDDGRLRVALHPTAMTLAGMLKHLARVEDSWFSDVVAEGGPVEPWAGMPWAAEWDNRVADTGEELRQL